MTQAMAKMGSERLAEMKIISGVPGHKFNDPQTLADLDEWWTAELRENENKVVSLDTWRERRRWLSK